MLRTIEFPRTNALGQCRTLRGSCSQQPDLNGRSDERPLMRIKATLPSFLETYGPTEAATGNLHRSRSRSRLENYISAVAISL